MCRLCVFGGTVEGRELTAWLATQGAAVTVCIATEYGETLVEPAENVTVLAGRLDENGMEQLFKENCFDCVIDATHPYAPIVTENIKTACQKAKTDYLRLLRGEDSLPESAACFPDAAAAAEYLAGTSGNILLTTGSKDLAVFAQIPGFSERVWARVLPVASSLEACAVAGLPAAHILAMQGPFSEDLNLALLRTINAQFLVTKSTGARGGFPEKVAAAKKAGAALLIIGRPSQEEGLSYREIVSALCERFGFAVRAKVSIIGIGPGSRDERTLHAEKAIMEADCVIGAGRMVEATAHPGQLALTAISPEAIRDLIRANAQCRRFAVVMSGDVGFFSGTKKLLPLLDKEEVELIPGLSSMVTLSARLGISYQDVTPISLHGRESRLFAALRRSKKLFVLVGGENGAGELCKKLSSFGFGSTRVAVGERLGYEDEKITCGTAEELQNTTFDSLSAVLLAHDENIVVTHGLPDEAFLRGAHADGSAVPMTKREVRACALSHLELTRDAVCWDIGAGTGSVSIEMALQADEGTVYAVEKKSAALELLKDNLQRFAVENVIIIDGAAPEACQDLPAPTHVFIGGSSGNVDKIIALALQKNPAVRIAATAIALETVGELTALMPRFDFAEAVSISAAVSRKAGPYHLMTGQNPVYLFTFQNDRKEPTA